MLSLSALKALLADATLREPMLSNDTFVNRFITVLQPSQWESLSVDATKTRYVQDVLAFVSLLGPAYNSLRIAVLYDQVCTACACVYVCMYACMYVCMNVCMYVRMHVVCMYVCMYACM